MTGTAAAKALLLGTFDAETLWRDEVLAKLPAVPDPQSRRIVHAMDELLFLFCRKGDALLTRYRMDPAHVDYLRGLGFDFTTNEWNLDDHQDSSGAFEPNVFKRLLASSSSQSIHQFLQEKYTIDAFAVLDGMDELCSRFALQSRAPEMDTIRNVNSKLYSTRLKDRLGLPNVSRIVTSHRELQEIGEEMLMTGPLLIKDTFGVSGKGNLLVQTEGVLERIASYIAGQERQGKAVLFILEPLLAKENDFSCQFYVDEDGDYRFISVQQVVNSDFAYQGSVSASPAFLEKLEQAGYFRLMRETARCLHESGYFGHVCVDSMELKDGSLVPIVEINARKSMSLIKNQLDRYLAERSLTGNLTYLSLVCPGELPFVHLLAALEREHLLYRPERDGGVFPLSANTFGVNQREGKRSKARLYVSVVADDAAKRSRLDAQFKQLIASLGIVLSN
ncbi:ATP-grasp domain-containing protein [Paenibacillus hamazuiensis]|uniref:ATP-grasp domain-containing protein n=1 Tax=Paenibacillus hamazuiensis TaxID=2936508 RepID=UPI00200C26F7|nr:ATP-grasp domain-containing protein [Paenibacillus hamazuiensis]